MDNPVPDYLAEVAEACASLTSGEPASYIPELAAVDPDRYGVAMATIDGTLYSVGDARREFTIQSISKAFVYGLAVRERGLTEVLRKVDVEPSGDPFDELSLEDGTGRPRNPMINAGAITAHALVGGDGVSSAGRFEEIHQLLCDLAGRELAVDEEVWASEMSVSDRNLAIAHLLRSHGIISDSPEEVVSAYVRQCAVLVTAEDLAVMAATLANAGVQPVTGQRIFSGQQVRHLLSVMLTCGMYDSAGDWVSNVGIPAKSGVGGGIIGALPGQVGIATFAPRLDPHGSSVRGIETFERLSHDMGLHLMEVAPPARSVIQRSRVVGEGEDAIRVFELAGTIGFTGAERVVRRLSEDEPVEQTIAVDLTHVHSVGGPARHMLLEALRRLRLDGYTVYLIDHDEVLPDPDPGDGEVVEQLQEL
ncbi:glutaminase [Janibacter sp. Soil728]|uniref:glutaminase n=1 Tax=Janibacter sp. Soil728 TaxID=1736393 RepID=UPI0006FC0AF7|nr:glutaminase [Janibacter sp. Soil728]KRE39206.1 glutaminase [Janibacter sp. Soil728]